MGKLKRVVTRNKVLQLICPVQEKIKKARSGIVFPGEEKYTWTYDDSLPLATKRSVT